MEAGAANVNTRQRRDEQSIGTEVDSLARPVLCTTPRRSRRDGDFEHTLFRIYEALQPLIAERLGEEHALLFAEPVADPRSGTIHWYATIAGDAIPYAELTAEDQAAVDTHLNKLLFNLMELARKLQTRAKTVEGLAAGQLLQILLDTAFVEKQHLYVVGYQPIVACWTSEPGAPSGGQASLQQPPPPLPVTTPAAEELPLPAVETEQPALARPSDSEAQTAFTATGERWPLLRLAAIFAALVVTAVAVFGLRPRQTVVDWLDRVEALKAREQTLLRIIARQERARNTETVAGEPESERLPVAPPPEAEEQLPDEGFYQPAAPKPLPPFESASGPQPLDKLAGAVVLLHFWTAAGPPDCTEIASFVSMTNAEAFEALRADGVEAYLVTTAESVEKGNALLRTCGVQDPLLLRDAGGQILAQLEAGAIAPVTVVYDKEDQRVLATYPRRNWNQGETYDELRRLLLMRVF